MNKKVHILGICGTLMAGIARLANELGFSVSGSDHTLAPPMSEQLKALGIALDNNMQTPPQEAGIILTGNILSRGQSIVESLLNQQLAYQSAPAWLYENILHSRQVVAITGTHGKTTTTSMIAWILEKNGQNPGFLIGGIAENFGVSARLGNSQSPFIIEADEYDTAFFDKRPKFLHYHPQLLVINNLEFDHADIYPDLTAIQKQFHYLLRQLPSTADIIYPHQHAAITEVIKQGCWSNQITLSHENNSNKQGDWQLSYHQGNIRINHQHHEVAIGSAPLIGEHNRQNILTAIATCHQLGISAQESLSALEEFKGIKRRLELKGQWHIPQTSSSHNNHIRLIDDFAHHPTAIQYTLQTLKKETLGSQLGNQSDNQNTHTRQLIALLDLTSNSMKQGAHKHLLADSLHRADTIFIWQNQGIQWNLQEYLCTQSLKNKLSIHQDIDDMINAIIRHLSHATQHTDIVMLSNGTFGEFPSKLIQRLDNIPTV